MSNNYTNRQDRSRSNRTPNNDPNSQALATITDDTKSGKLALALGMPKEYVQLVKDVAAKQATDEEFFLFLNVIHKTGLNPLTREIWFYKMYDAQVGRELPVIHASIQGFRVAAEKQGGYIPGRETVYEYDNNNQLYSATAFVKRKIDGDWHEVSFTAYWDEFNKGVNKWKTMPKHMLGKCAETHALKRAFPALESLTEPDAIPVSIANAAPAFNTPEQEPEPDENEQRQRDLAIEGLEAMANILLSEEDQVKLMGWLETAALPAIMEKFHNGLSQFTQFARGVYDRLPEDVRKSSLAEFDVSAFEELSFEPLIRYVLAYEEMAKPPADQ